MTGRGAAGVLEASRLAGARPGRPTVSAGSGAPSDSSASHHALDVRRQRLPLDRHGRRPGPDQPRGCERGQHDQGRVQEPRWTGRSVVHGPLVDSTAPAAGRAERLPVAQWGIRVPGQSALTTSVIYQGRGAFRARGRSPAGDPIHRSPSPPGRRGSAKDGDFEGQGRAGLERRGFARGRLNRTGRRICAEGLPGSKAPKYSVFASSLLIPELLRGLPARNHGPAELQESGRDVGGSPQDEVIRTFLAPVHQPVDGRFAP